MLKDVIEFVMARTGLDRATALREINFAWKELWNSDDLPGSLQDVSIQTSSTRIALPWYVGEIRAVKRNTDKTRVTLNTPRPYYHDNVVWQTDLTWRIFGPQPLMRNLDNATTLDVSIDDAEEENLSVVLIGPDDTAQTRREELIFTPGVTSKTSTYRFSDLSALTKSIITKSDVHVTATENVEVGFIPNLRFEASHLLVQINDDCDVHAARCFDILYKQVTPYLYYDETPVPFQEVLMAKTLEWISIPKDEQLSKTEAFSQKATSLLQQFNNNEKSVDKVMDIGRNPYTSNYHGYL